MMRWLIRLESAGPLKFGQSPREVLMWVVRPYVAATPDRRHFLGPAQSFRALPAAHNYARKEACRLDARRRTLEEATKWPKR